jgi:hypothetical protein
MLQLTATCSLPCRMLQSVQKGVRDMTSLEQEVMELKTRVERLEATLGRLTGDLPLPAGEPGNQKQLLAWLKAEGVVRDPTPEERELAAEWDALPEEEKQAIRRELDHLPPGPMASDVVIENRQ